MARNKPAMTSQWLLPMVAETWDGYLDDINGPHVTVDHAMAAIDSAAAGSIEQGSVGGGTGMNCYAFKGGSTLSTPLWCRRPRRPCSTPWSRTRR